jgi:hypothetical protein
MPLGKKKPAVKENKLISRVAEDAEPNSRAGTRELKTKRECSKGCCEVWKAADVSPWYGGCAGEPLSI